MKILIVDDEAAILRSLSRLLGRLGHDVRCASGFAEALQQAAASTPDMVLSDVSMQGPDGIDLLQTLRTRFPGLPVVLMTGFDGDAPIRAVRHGARDFLRKPVSLERLRECLDRMERELDLAGELAQPLHARLWPARSDADTPLPTLPAVSAAVEVLRAQVARLEAGLATAIPAVDAAADSRQICTALRLGLAQLDEALAAARGSAR